MKVLLTGGSGQLGYELQHSKPAGMSLVMPARDVFELRDAESIKAYIKNNKPQLIINAAAYTAVDKAESEPELVYTINSKAAQVMAETAAEIDARMIHISTDFVFSGVQSSPYKIDDLPDPLGVYGLSKLEGERLVAESLPDAVIVRTSWLYSAHGSNFVKTMLRLMSEREELGVVVDQIGTPTWAASLANMVWSLLEVEQRRGIYHWSDAGVASWYDFAVAIYEEATAMGLLNATVKIRPISSNEYPTPAKRPSYSVLDKSRSYDEIGMATQHWRSALREMLAELTEGKNA